MTSQVMKIDNALILTIWRVFQVIDCKFVVADVEPPYYIAWQMIDSATALNLFLFEITFLFLTLTPF